jgi:hypothetical protein
MKLLNLLIALAVGALPIRAQEKKHYVIYAMLLEKAPVELSDGARWMMDKGDTFPVEMFKEGGTKVVLQLAGVNFRVDAQKVKVIEEKDITAEQLASYRANVETYLTNRSRQWKEQAAQKK